MDVICYNMQLNHRKKVIGTYDGRTPEKTMCRVTLEIDGPRLARMLGERAITNRSRKSKLASGLIIATVKPL